MHALAFAHRMLIHLSNSARQGVTSISDTPSLISFWRLLRLTGFNVKPQIQGIGHSQAAPRTPLESPCIAGRIGVSTPSEKA